MPRITAPRRVTARAGSRVGQELADRLTVRLSMRTRRRLARARLDLRRPTATLRLLPDFLVIGAQRCGTSSLYKYLGRHPEVVPSLRKEIEYFTFHYHRGENWYRAHFPLRLRREYLRLRGRGLQTFEASPDYLFDPRVPGRAAELIPDARLIALLRNPIDRAFSHYQHAVRLGQEPLAFEEAIEREPERLAGEWDRLLADPAYPARDLGRYSYVARGIYVDQLARWMERFPRRRILVVRSEDLYERAPQTFAGILDFLELPEWQPAEFRNYSYAERSRPDGPAMPEADRSRLEEIFAPHNRRLYELLDTDFAWETRPDRPLPPLTKEEIGDVPQEAHQRQPSQGDHPRHHRRLRP